ncbi:transcriptional regulator [Ensifer sp. Root31]|uniref:GlxA family transcriptional regulator n=1 Tax=Ensifer sp. Root31 TaxID=1736512 RepID=UPI00070C6866|nr:DJ-1/PfpI family protein [Ensifer sp. Root31]KQU86408.1 transcriptional regulator [Ensifer sp. Root31]
MVRLMNARRKIVFLTFPDVASLDISGPADVFHLARDFLDDDQNGYEVVIASVTGGHIQCSNGMTIDTVDLRGIEANSIDTLIVPGGGPPQSPPVPLDAVAWLAHHGSDARRVCSVCTGAFLLAEAGLADGRRLATHWQAGEELAARYPRIEVERDLLFVADGDIWSSAGFTAGIDLSLALIEADHGYAIAIALARMLVMFLKRPGGQSQFSAPLASQTARDPTFDKLHAWIANSLNGDLRVETLAAQVNMAPRTFARRYAAVVGRTPGRTIELIRLDAACSALLEKDTSLKAIAAKTGFGDEQNLRRTFLRNFGILPGDYRERFASTEPIWQKMTV